MNDSFSALMNEYRASFETKAEDIESAVELADNHHWSGASVETLASLAHKLAGSSGAYGFDDIYHQARSVNDCIKHIRTLETPSSASIAEIKQATALLVSTLRRHADSVA